MGEPETITLREWASQHYGEPVSIKWSKDHWYVQFGDGAKATFTHLNPGVEFGPKGDYPE